MQNSKTFGVEEHIFMVWDFHQQIDKLNCIKIKNLCT